MPPSLIEPVSIGLKGSETSNCFNSPVPKHESQESIVEREVDVGDERRHRGETFQQRRQVVSGGGLGGNFDHFPDPPVAALARAFAVPYPISDEERSFETGDYADEAVGLGRIVGRSQLQNHLLLGSELQCLKVASIVEIPDVQRVAVPAGEEQLRVHAVLHHVRRAPLAGDHDVATEVPPEVVGEILGAALALPSAFDLEGLRIDHEDSTRTVAFTIPRAFT